MDLLQTARDPAAWGAALGAVGIALLVVTVTTARRPQRPVPDLAGFFAGWQAAHDGYDPARGSVWVRGWLITVHRLARPLARAGVQPDVLTLWTVWVGLAAVVAAHAGGSWAALAAWLVVFSGLADALDGAVAVLTRRTSRWGYVLDSAVDRCNDVLFAVALVLVGAPWWAAALYVVLFFELEYVRARAGNAGGSPIGTITVGERANRVAFCAAGLFVAGVLPAQAVRAVSVTMGVLIVLSAIGLAQLLRAVRRELSGSGGTDELRDDRRRQRHQRHPPAGM